MKTIILLLNLAVLLVLKTWAQDSPITVLDSSFHEIISPNTAIETVGQGFNFTEGPVWATEGYLLFSDIPENKIYKIDEQGKSVYQEPSGKSNGLSFDQEGRLVKCEHGNRRLSRVEANGEITVLADQYKGKKLNSPNDLTIHSSGIIFFTDPPWGLEKQDDDPDKELDFNGLYRWNKGKLELIDSTMVRPNGIVLSPDEQYLYVADWDKHWYRYSVDTKGQVSNKKLFFDGTGLEEDGPPDGIKVDVDGNVYLTGPGGLLVLDQEGKHLGTVTFPQLPANCAFGGEDMKTLYLTCRTGVYSIRVNNKGVRN